MVQANFVLVFSKTKQPVFYGINPCNSTRDNNHSRGRPTSSYRKNHHAERRRSTHSLTQIFLVELSAWYLTLFSVSQVSTQDKTVTGIKGDGEN